MYLLKQGVAGVLCAALILDPIIFAAPAASAPNKLPEIPASFGRVEESFQGSIGKTVVYLQDAHDSLEAQENIAKMIGFLVENSGVKTVYEEGYEGPVPTDSYFSFISNSNLRRKISYFFLDKLRIGGAEYAHINRKKEFRLIGADSIKLHLENIAKYQESSKLQKATQEDLSVLYQKIKLLADRHFSKEMKEWLKLREKFESDQIGMLDYLKRAYPRGDKNLKNILLLLAAENPKNAAALEQAKAIDAKELFYEIGLMEEDIARRFLQDGRSQKIFHYYKQIDLLKRLSEIRVTSAEYENARETLAGLNAPELAEFIARETQSPVLLSREWERNIQAAGQFYEIAHKRDEAMAGTLNEFLKNPDEKTAVLVFGGFHKDKIKSFLRASGCSYQIISPRISGPDKIHQAYYKQLMSNGNPSFEISPALALASRAATLFVIPSGRREVVDVFIRAGQIRNLPDPVFLREMEAGLAERLEMTPRSEMRTYKPIDPEYGLRILDSVYLWKEPAASVFPELKSSFLAHDVEDSEEHARFLTKMTAAGFQGAVQPQDKGMIIYMGESSVTGETNAVRRKVFFLAASFYSALNVLNKADRETLIQATKGIFTKPQIVEGIQKQNFSIDAFIFTIGHAVQIAPQVTGAFGAKEETNFLEESRKAFDAIRGEWKKRYLEIDENYLYYKREIENAKNQTLAQQVLASLLNEELEFGIRIQPGDIELALDGEGSAAKHIRNVLHHHMLPYSRKKMLPRAQRILDLVKAGLNQRSELRAQEDFERMEREISAFIREISTQRLDQLLYVSDFEEVKDAYGDYIYFQNRLKNEDGWNAQRKLSFQIPQLLALKDILEKLLAIQVDETKDFSNRRFLKKFIRDMNALGFSTASSLPGDSLEAIRAQLEDIVESYKAEVNVPLGRVNEFLEARVSWTDPVLQLNPLSPERAGDFAAFLSGEISSNPLIEKISEAARRNPAMALNLNPQLSALIHVSEKLDEIRQAYSEETEAIDRIQSLGRIRNYFKSTGRSIFAMDIPAPDLSILISMNVLPPDFSSISNVLRPFLDYYLMVSAGMTGRNFPLYTQIQDYDQFLRTKNQPAFAGEAKVFTLRAYALLRAFEIAAKETRSELRASDPEKITDAHSVEFYKINRELIALFAEHKKVKSKNNSALEESILASIRGFAGYTGLFIPQIQEADQAGNQTLAELEQKNQEELKTLAIGLGRQISAYDKKFIDAQRENNQQLLEQYNREVVRLLKQRLKIQLLRLRHELDQPGVIARQTPVLTIVLSVVEIYRRLSYEHFWRGLRAGGQRQISRFRMVDAAGNLVFNIYYEKEPVLRVERENAEMRLFQIVWKHVEVRGGPHALQPVLTPLAFENIDTALRSRIHTLASQEQDFTQLIYHDFALQDILRTLRMYESKPADMGQAVKKQVRESIESVLTGPEGKGGLRKKVARVRNPRKRDAMLPMPGKSLEAAQALIEVDNFKEAIGLVESARGYISGRLTDIDHKKDATIRKRDYAQLLIRFDDLGTGLNRLKSALENLPLQHTEIVRAHEILETIRQQHFDFIANETTYRELRLDLQGIIAALRTLEANVVRSQTRAGEAAAEIQGRQGLLVKVNSVLWKLEGMKKEKSPVQKTFDLGKDPSGPRSELRLAAVQEGVFDQKRTLIDFNDLAANFSDAQIEEILFVAQKAGKNSAVHIYNLDPTHKMGRFLASLKINGLKVSSKALDPVLASDLKNFSGEVVHLSSSDSLLQAEKLKAQLLEAGIQEVSAYSLAYHDKESGTLGVGLKDIEEGKLKNQLPDYMAVDSRGRIYLSDSSVAGAWQALYQSTLAFSRAA